LCICPREDLQNQENDIISINVPNVMLGKQESDDNTHTDFEETGKTSIPLYRYNNDVVCNQKLDNYDDDVGNESNKEWNKKETPNHSPCNHLLEDDCIEFPLYHENEHDNVVEIPSYDKKVAYYIEQKIFLYYMFFLFLC